MLDIDEAPEPSNGHFHGGFSAEDPLDRVSGFAAMNESSISTRPTKRPTRESVLKRLSEALMRRTLTKVSSHNDNAINIVFLCVPLNALLLSL